MSVISQRILVAAFLSIAGCLITYFLTTSKTTTVHAIDEEPVAVLVTSENEVQRRLAERLVWRRIFDNQLVYPGEAIRTDAASIATLEFINKKTVIQLEPDTVIEIEKGGKGVNLDFLKGNVFIKSETADALTLNSNGKKVEIGNAEVSLAKTDNNANMQMEVVKGTVQDSQPSTEQKIELITPLARQIIYVDSGEKKAVDVSWKPIAKEYQVSVETGSAPQKLSKLGGVDAVAGDSKLQINLPTGRHYFRLIAVDPTAKLPQLTSFSRRIEIRPKLAPIALEPSRNSLVTAVGEKPLVRFRWANPGQLENLILEFARSADLRVDYGSERMNRELSLELPLRWKDGEIFWRVSGTIPGSKDSISSKIVKFTLEQSNGQKLVATPIPTVAPTSTPFPSPTPTPTVSPTPTLTPIPSPSPSPTITATPTPEPKVQPPQVDEAVKEEGITGKTDGSAEVKWKPVQNAKEYQVQVRDSKGSLAQVKRVKGNVTTLTDLKTGEYSVTLNSIDKNGQVSASSSVIKMTIPEYSSVRAPKIKSMNIK